MKRLLCLIAICVGLAWACGFDQALREYLSVQFWLPFAKHGGHFERPNVRRADAAFAGMTRVQSDSPLDKLRAAYQDGELSAVLRPAVAAARADRSLTRRQREEVDLIDAKIELRIDDLEGAKKKLQAFLRAARTPEFLSEARGWLGRVHYLQGNQAAAGKIYLDELNRDGSNLSRKTLLNSLKMTYRYDGGPKLLAELEQYFDTPEHAAFAIQLATNPHWHHNERFERGRKEAETYARIRALVEKHRDLLASNNGADRLAILLIRTALRMGDTAAARAAAEAVPSDAAIRRNPDFLWMLAATRFLSRDYPAAEEPLLALFRSQSASQPQRSAAAYALCGVYSKTGNRHEQLRFALWLREDSGSAWDTSYTLGIDDLGVYLAASGWDLNLLLDTEASIDDLRAFIDRNPNLPNIRLVRYALAVRLTRDDQYGEAAAIYQSIRAVRRAPRLRRLAALYSEANRADLDPAARLQARFRLAEFLGSYPGGIYYNDSLWSGLQRYALSGATDVRLNRAERNTLLANERKLKDDQEEYWRAYQILHEIVREAGHTALGRRAARLAIVNLRRIATDRFGREDEIRAADTELSNWLLARSG